MIDPITLTIIIFGHFIADFVCQNRWMGENKSSNYKALFAHCSVYFSALLIITLIFLNFEATTIFQYVFINSIIHCIVDFLTSRTSKYVHKKIKDSTYLIQDDGEWKREGCWEWMFWNVIGFDQFLHVATLILTYQIFLA